MTVNDLQQDLLISEGWIGGEAPAYIEVNGVRYEVEAVRHNDDEAMVIEAGEVIPG